MAKVNFTIFISLEFKEGYFTQMLKHMNWDCQMQISLKLNAYLRRIALHFKSITFNWWHAKLPEYNIWFIVFLLLGYTAEMGKPEGVKRNLIFSWRKNIRDRRLIKINLMKLWHYFNEPHHWEKRGILAVQGTAFLWLSFLFNEMMYQLSKPPYSHV